eukprot:2891768-Karenia_brevis.AAC.1
MANLGHHTLCGRDRSRLGKQRQQCIIAALRDEIKSLQTQCGFFTDLLGDHFDAITEVASTHAKSSLSEFDHASPGHFDAA